MTLEFSVALAHEAPAEPLCNGALLLVWAFDGVCPSIHVLYICRRLPFCAYLGVRWYTKPKDMVHICCLIHTTTLSGMGKWSAFYSARGTCSACSQAKICWRALRCKPWSHGWALELTLDLMNLSCSISGNTSAYLKLAGCSWLGWERRLQRSAQVRSLKRLKPTARHRESECLLWTNIFAGWIAEGFSFAHENSAGPNRLLFIAFCLRSHSYAFSSSQPMAGFYWRGSICTP